MLISVFDCAGATTKEVFVRFSIIRVKTQPRPKLIAANALNFSTPKIESPISVVV